MPFQVVEYDMWVLRDLEVRAHIEMSSLRDMYLSFIMCKRGSISHLVLKSRGGDK